VSISRKSTDPALSSLHALQTRRQLLKTSAVGFGHLALQALLGQESSAASTNPLVPQQPHHPPRARRIVFLFMKGGPSHVDTFDPKPMLDRDHGKPLPFDLPRVTFAKQGNLLKSPWKFHQYGESGLPVSELFPHVARHIDDLCILRSVYGTNPAHGGALLKLHTGSDQFVRPSMGSWVTYGLGTENENLPAFVVLVAIPSNREQEQAISARLWSAGYLPGQHAGVSFRSQGDPILYINNPPGIPDSIRQRSIEGLNRLNALNYEQFGDPETQTRIQQYEMAFRMQASVPELTDLSQEPKHIFDLYGEEAKKPGTFANTALMTRRLAERGVRFIQVYHNNWDHHGNVAGRMPAQCRDVDKPCYALIEDLKQRGMFDDTLIIWGGEFGRTIYSQGGLSKENYGRDHHPRCFTMWMAGGGARGGQIYGETDDFSYNIVKDPIHIRDFHATILHLLGFDHERFTYKFQGLEQKLTGVEPAHVIPDLLA